jgi:hypothetical protein
MKAPVTFLLLAPATPLHRYLPFLLIPSEILRTPLMVLPLFLNGKLPRNHLIGRAEPLKMRSKITVTRNQLSNGTRLRWTGTKACCSFVK